MKVWLVEEQWYDSYALHGIFSSYEKALAFCIKTPSEFIGPNMLSDSNIQEIIVDEKS